MNSKAEWKLSNGVKREPLTRALVLSREQNLGLNETPI